MAIMFPVDKTIPSWDSWLKNVGKIFRFWNDTIKAEEVEDNIDRA